MSRDRENGRGNIKKKRGRQIYKLHLDAVVCKDPYVSSIVIHMWGWINNDNNSSII
jgi:hypothetical protein